jgi:hypothetical protein
VPGDRGQLIHLRSAVAGAGIAPGLLAIGSCFAVLVVISSWSVEDRGQSRLDVALELVRVWAVHLHRSYRLIRGA